MGSGVRGWAMLREVRVWFEVWRTVNGFPPSIPKTATGGSGSASTSSKSTY
jgi:membrane fusion protein, adhesin transport system